MSLQIYVKHVWISWLVSLLLVTGNIAASSAGEMESAAKGAQLIAAATACDISLSKLTQVNWKGEKTISYKADNEQMHRCLFMFELAASNCVEIKACTKYEEWSIKNSDVSPKLPKQVFWQKYEERIDALALSQRRYERTK